MYLGCFWAKTENAPILRRTHVESDFEPNRDKSTALLSNHSACEIGAIGITNRMELMATDKQIAANKKNAQASTGPKSTEGKLVSKMNAVKHGILAADVVIDGEDEELFAELLAALMTELDPMGSVERQLVERIAVSMWRLKRVNRGEASLFLHQRLSVEVQNATDSAAQIKQSHELIPGIDFSLSPEGRDRLDSFEKVIDNLQQKLSSGAAATGAGFIDDAMGANAISKLSRYEVAIERSLYRAMHELQRLQSARLNPNKISVPLAVDITVDKDD